jgi:hypothetical protein
MIEKVLEKIKLDRLFIIDWRANGGDVIGKAYYWLPYRHLKDSIGDRDCIRRLFCQIGFTCVRDSEWALSTRRSSNPS